MRAVIGRRMVAALALAAMAAAGCIGLAVPAEAQSSVCLQIRSRIAQLDAAPSGGATARRFAAAAQRQRAELATATRTYQAAGCGGFFQSAQCSALDNRRRQMQANLARLEAEAGGGGMETAQRAQMRAQLVAAFDAQGCRGGGARQAAAPQPPGFFGFGSAPEREVYREYRTPGGRPQTAYREGYEPQRSGFGNFIEHLFGRSDPRPPALDSDIAAVPEEQLRPNDGDERPRNVGHRAVCVRLCDGAFFPMTSSPRPGMSLNQEEMCQMQCPGAETALYRMRDDQIENAVSVEGEPYTALPNALKFRQRFDAACTCRPRNGSWAEAFTNRADPTLRSGDQVISAEQARILSMPAEQRSAAREEAAASERARREAERQARTDRGRGRDGAPRPTIGLDGTIRQPVDNDPPAIRGTTVPSGATQAAPVPAAAAPEPPSPAEERRPVRVIGPAYAPRADAATAPSGG